MRRIYLLILIIIVSSTTTFSQEMTGKWNGLLNVQGTQLPLIFKITANEDSYKGTFDSPKQGAKDIPFSAVTINGQHIKLDASNIGAFYEGDLKGDSIIGSWNQGGASIPLVLYRKELKETKPFRPQEPTGELPYQATEVQFLNAKDDIKLAGTLTVPTDGVGPYPAVILISGSGPQNRNEEVFGHKPFLVLADHLTRQGIAVLRYDDRGTADSEGDFSTATTANFATDALSAVKFLKTLKEIDQNQIGLIGHSEGGIIAPMVANQTEAISYLVLLASTGVAGKELSLMQSQTLNTLDSENKEDYYEFNKELLDIATSDLALEEKRKKMKSHFKSHQTIIKNLVPEGTDLDNFIKMQINSSLSPWAQYFFKYNPADELEHITIPVLSLNGSLDVQVDAATNQSAIKVALEKAGNTKYTLKELEGLNHMFQESETGAMIEYGNIEQTFSPIALAEISSWIIEITN